MELSPAVVPKPKWTDERVERFKTMWAEGYTASQIASMLGGTTRNAVIGKRHRMGLAGRQKPKAPPKPPRPPRPEPKWISATVPALLEQAPLPEPEFVANPMPKRQRRTLLQLTNETCRWPIGHPGAPDFFFCGGQTATGPYCAGHGRIAYKPFGRRGEDDYRYVAARAT